jgi:predicted GTPase
MRRFHDFIQRKVKSFHGSQIPASIPARVVGIERYMLIDTAGIRKQRRVEP